MTTNNLVTRLRNDKCMVETDNMIGIFEYQTRPLSAEAANVIQFLTEKLAKAEREIERLKEVWRKARNQALEEAARVADMRAELWRKPPNTRCDFALVKECEAIAAFIRALQKDKGE